MELSTREFPEKIHLNRWSCRELPYFQNSSQHLILQHISALSKIMTNDWLHATVMFLVGHFTRGLWIVSGCVESAIYIACRGFFFKINVSHRVSNVLYVGILHRNFTNYRRFSQFFAPGYCSLHCTTQKILLFTQHKWLSPKSTCTSYLLNFDEYERSVTSPNPKENDVHTTPKIACHSASANAIRRNPATCSEHTRNIRRLDSKK